MERDSVDVMTDRNELLRQFRSLCLSLADHPNLSHQFVNHLALPDAEHEAVTDAAEAEWRKGVEAGTYPDDYDAEDAFVVSRVVAEVPLCPICVQLAEEYRAMLRTLEIPEGWCGSHAVFAA